MVLTTKDCLITPDVPNGENRCGMHAHTSIVMIFIMAIGDIRGLGQEYAHRSEVARVTRLRCYYFSDLTTISFFFALPASINPSSLPPSLSLSSRDGCSAWGTRRCTLWRQSTTALWDACDCRAACGAACWNVCEGDPLSPIATDSPTMGQGACSLTAHWREFRSNVGDGDVCTMYEGYFTCGCSSA